MRITKVYTKGGDDGSTALIGGTRVAKYHPRVEAYGVLDELNSVIGCLVQTIGGDLTEKTLAPMLTKIQHQLFDLGARLAADSDETRAKMPIIADEEIKQLESHIDQLNESLPALSSFVLPGGGNTSAWFHLARTTCRRAERRVVELSENDTVEPSTIVYLNRLSDAFFVFGRWASNQQGTPEQLWQPNLRKTDSK